MFSVDFKGYFSTAAPIGEFYNSHVDRSANFNRALSRHRNLPRFPGVSQKTLPCRIDPGQDVGTPLVRRFVTDRKSIHLVSDSTGETLYSVAKAVLSRFSEADIELHVSVFVRSAEDLQVATDLIRAKPGLILFTVVDDAARRGIMKVADELNLKALPVLDPLIGEVADYLDQTPQQRAGMQYQLNDDYFARISALDFAISHDDGALGDRMRTADVILAGVSRSSKTPTCIYLAYRGIKAANMPFVPSQDPNPAFFEAMAAGVPVIGLTASPNRLAQIRALRLEALGDRTQAYADLDAIREEVAAARLFFQRHDIPVIDVTRRSIEETAAEIRAMLRARRSDAP